MLLQDFAQLLTQGQIVPLQRFLVGLAKLFKNLRGNFLATDQGYKRKTFGSLIQFYIFFLRGFVQGPKRTFLLFLFNLAQF